MYWEIKEKKREDYTGKMNIFVNVSLLTGQNVCMENLVY